MGVDRDRDGAELTELLHVFDHELRTPLTALRGHLELITDQAARLPPEVLASVHVMARAVERLESTVDGVAWMEQTVTELRSVS